jgi:hypothetical protein
MLRYARLTPVVVVAPRSGLTWRKPVAVISNVVEEDSAGQPAVQK